MPTAAGLWPKSAGGEQAYFYDSNGCLYSVCLVRCCARSAAYDTSKLYLTTAVDSDRFSILYANVCRLAQLFWAVLGGGKPSGAIDGMSAFRQARQQIKLPLHGYIP